MIGNGYTVHIREVMGSSPLSPIWVYLRAYGSIREDNHDLQQERPPKPHKL